MPYFFNKYFFVLIISFSVFSAKSQNFLDLWEENHNARLKPDSAFTTDKDAVVLLQKKLVMYDLRNFGKQNDLRLFCMETYYLQIYLPNDRSAHNFTSIKLPLKTNQNLIYIRVRNTKPNDSFIDLDPGEIKFVQLQHQSSQEFEQNYHFIPVPGVEGGDIIELFAVMVSYNQYASQTVLFHHELPVQKSIFEFKYHAYLKPLLASYNGDLTAVVKEMGDYTSFIYTLEKLKPLKNQMGVLPEFELPHVKYTIKSLKIPGPYGDMVDQEINSVSWPDFLKRIVLEINNEAGLSLPSEIRWNYTWFQNFASQYPEVGKLELASHFQNFVNQELNYLSPDQDTRYGLLSEMVEHKKIDRVNLFAFYHAFFKHFEIDHWLFSTKQTDYGCIDSVHVFPDEQDDLLFGFEMDGQMHFLMPKKSEWLFMDELPVRIRGNLAVGMSFKPLETKLKVIKVELLPMDRNCRMRKFNCTVENLDQERLKVQSENISKGDVATDLRDFYGKMYIFTDNKTIFENFFVEDFGHIVLDTFVFPGKIADGPNTLTYSFSYSMDNFIVKQTPGIYSVSVDKLARVDQLNLLDIKRDFGFYNPTPFRGTSIFTLKLNQDVEILNLQDLNCSYSNSFGLAGLQVSMPGAREIQIEMTFESNAFYTAPQNFKDAIALLNQSNNLLGKYILIKPAR